MQDVKTLIAQMTLAEKASLCSGLNLWQLKGLERLGIPSIMVTDGPHGLRKQIGDADHVGLNDSVPATCYPTASALAATWNRDLIFEVGKALAEECKQEQVSVILGPGANIKRSPLCGRNFEYFSEDPYLTGEIARSHINGVQSLGIGTSLKHYAINNQETRRMVIDAIIDERALREIYLPGYEIAVKESQPWTVMCTYNRVNGTYGSDHTKLMRTILKEEWGHTGLVITDWGAMNDRPVALAAGTELEMPGSPNGNDELIVKAVQLGTLDEAVLNEAVERIITMIFKAQDALEPDFAYDADAHHALARKVAGEGAVLLKNEGALPVEAGAQIALVGRFAKEPRYQGAGSSLINPTQLDTLYDELVKLLGSNAVGYAPGYTVKGEKSDPHLTQQAVSMASWADVVIICAGLPDTYEVEGMDRTHMDLPVAHNALIKALAKVHDNVVVVLSNGSPVAMPWVDDVQAILEGYLGGQAGAGGVADILTGKVNPSAKLAETFPVALEDNPSFPYFPGGPMTVEYRESLYVGYRYYDSVRERVLFPFGHGLSYTRFGYSSLTVNTSSLTLPGTLTVSIMVTNTGDVAGSEIVQLYVRDVESTAFRPYKELKGFVKVALQPGESRTVSMTLDQRVFAWYNPDVAAWQVESGDFDLLIGASSRDIRLRKTVTVISDDPTPVVDRDALATYYDLPKAQSISRQAFEALLGHPVPPNEAHHKGEYTLNTPIADMRESWIGRMLFKIMQREMNKMVAGMEDTPQGQLFNAMLYEMPLRSMLMTGGGPFNRTQLQAIVHLANGKVLKGLSTFITGRG